MIVRIQFIRKDAKSILYPWSLFCVQETWTLREIFDKIKTGEVSCGRGIVLTHSDDNSLLASTISSSKIPTDTDLMPTSLEIPIVSLIVNQLPVYIMFEFTLVEQNNNNNEINELEGPSRTLDTVTDVLMKKTNHYVDLKPVTKKCDIKQYNTLVCITR